MANFLADIDNWLQLTIKKFFDLDQNLSIELTQPVNDQFGNLTTNVALHSYSVLNQKKKFTDPWHLARQLADYLNQKKLGIIENIKVIKPGFINFYLHPSCLISTVKTLDNEISNNHFFLTTTKWSGKTIVVEYTDPNPFKELHIGHLYSNIVGESMSRLLETTQAKVIRVCYQGDVGMHVAKSVWGLKKKLEQDQLSLEELNQRSLSDRIKYLGQAYALGSNEFTDNKDVPEQIKDVNYLIYIAGQELLQKEQSWKPQIDYRQFLKENKFDYHEIRNLYFTGRKWSLDYFELIYQRLGTKFEDYFFESLVGEIGAKLVSENLTNGIFTKSQGAIIFKGSEYQLHDRVFINSLGLPTYEAKELGLAPEKYRRFAYDYSIIITGNEIDEYFRVLLKVLSLINPSLANKTRHFSHGMVRLPAGKMSSRSGNVITGEWLLNEASKMVFDNFVNDKTTWSDEKKQQTAQVIGDGAIKFALLSSSLGNNIAFNFQSSLSFSGYSGPYIQYTYARCISVLKKSKTKKITLNLDKINFEKLTKEEIKVFTVLSFYQSFVNKAVTNLAPHVITNYLFDLAQAYNIFYTQIPILKTTEHQELRLFLTKTTSIVLKHGLFLLGIKTCEEM